MKKIKKEAVATTTGLVKLASATEYINEGIFGYLLETEEEQAEACPYSTCDSICSTCTICSEEGCKHYVFLQDGIQCHV